MSVHDRRPFEMTGEVLDFDEFLSSEQLYTCNECDCDTLQIGIPVCSSCGSRDVGHWLYHFDVQLKQQLHAKPDPLRHPSQHHRRFVPMTQPSKGIFDSSGKLVDAASFASDLTVAYPWNKVAVGGFAGGGKSRTSAEIMAGIYKLLKMRNLLKYDAPLLIIDTEQASQFLVEFFKAQGVPVKWKRTKSLADVKTAFDLAQGGSFFGVYIDSMTHVYKDFLEAFQRQNRIERLEMRHFGQINPLWEREFGQHMVASETHIVFTGRGAADYEQTTDEETGKKTMEKSGVKMQISKDSPFDPNLVVWMSAQQRVVKNLPKVWRSAFIMKDRSATIDGKTFGSEKTGGPCWKDFAPHFEFLLKNYDPMQSPVAGTTTHTDTLVAAQERDPNIARREKAIAEIKAQLNLVAPGASPSEKQAKAAIFQRAFGAASFKVVETLPLGELESGLEKVKEDVLSTLKAMEVAA